MIEIGRDMVESWLRFLAYTSGRIARTKRIGTAERKGPHQFIKEKFGEIGSRFRKLESIEGEYKSSYSAGQWKSWSGRNVFGYPWKWPSAAILGFTVLCPYLEKNSPRLGGFISEFNFKIVRDFRNWRKQFQLGMRVK